MPRLLGQKLRYLRRKDGMTQVELADRLALASHAHIANLEAGRDVASLSLVLRVAALFGVSTDYLLRDTISVGVVTTSAITNIPNSEQPAHLVGAKLRALRRQQRLTQVELARRLGLARQGYVSNLETGRKAPSLDLVVQIADLFEVTTDYLLRESLPVGELGSGMEG
jgi:transcriptional regulator with XRE-family HTH domain